MRWLCVSSLPICVNTVNWKNRFLYQCSGPCHIYRSYLMQNTQVSFFLSNASGFSALQASPSVIEIHDSMTECEEEARPNLVQMEEKAFIASLHSFMKDRGSPIERIPHLGFKQSEFMSAALAGEWTQYSHGIWTKKTSCVCLFHSQFIFGASTKLWRNLGAMIQ